MATYTVSRGDNLTAIAQRFKVSPVEIARANGIQDPNLIEVGQVLTIPEPEPLPGEAMGDQNIRLSEVVGNPETGPLLDTLSPPASGQRGFVEPPTPEEIQQADTEEVRQAEIAGQLLDQEKPLLPMDAESAQSQIPTEGPTGPDTATVVGKPGVQSKGGLTSIMTGEPQVGPEAPDLLKPPEEAAPAVPAETAATEVAAVEPAEPSTEELTIEEAQSIAPQPVSEALTAYRQYVTDLQNIKPADVTITRNQIKEMDQQITGYNTRIQSIAEERAKPFFGKEDTGRKFLAAIAAGLGAYAAAMTGTRNFALDTINAAIEQDLQQQQASKEFRLRDLEGQRALLLERRGELLQYAQNQINANLQLAKDQGVAAGNLAQLEQAQQKIEQQALKNEQDLKLQIAKAQAAAVTKVTELTVPGVGIARSQADKKTYLEFYTAKETLKSRIDEILNLIKESGVEKYVPTSTVNTKLSSLLSEIQGNYKNRVANTGAATTVQEMNRFITKVAPDWTIGSQLGEIVGSTVTTRLQALKSAMEEDDRMLKGLYILGGPEKQAKKESSGIPGAQAGVQ